jgi:hypothetical protein
VQEENLLVWKNYLKKLSEDQGEEAFFRAAEPVRKAILGDNYKKPVYFYLSNLLINFS